jgi:hypothetical protein
VSYQTDNNSNPAFLQKASSGNYINLFISPIPTVVAFAHENTDYLFEEVNTVLNAWGPFNDSTQYWLYWDINLLTAVRTFGLTKWSPITSLTAPQNPKVDQHWFNLANTSMNFWNGSRWVEVVRCFAGSYDGSTPNPHRSGTQVSLGFPVKAGYILFDDDEKPVKKWKRDNSGLFLTTETPMLTHSSRISNIVLDGATQVVKANQNIPAWSAVTLDGYDSIVLASHFDQTRPSIGITRWDMSPGDVGIITSRGYITNNNWNWSVPATSPLFVGESGQITTTVPQTGSIQQIGVVVNSDTILVDIKTQIILEAV